MGNVLYDNYLGTGKGLGELEIVYDSEYLHKDYELLPLFYGEAQSEDNLLLVYAHPDENGETVRAEAAVLYGNFIQNVVDFLIIAVSIFLVIRILNRKKIAAEKAAAEAAANAPKAPTEAELLSEIRDLLKEKN